MEVAFKQFKEGRPCFKDKKRCFYVQSDGASKIDCLLKTVVVVFSFSFDL
jgi:hypothetical protein